MCSTVRGWYSTHTVVDMITTISVPFVRDAVFKLLPSALQQIKNLSVAASKQISVPIWDNIKVSLLLCNISQPCNEADQNRLDASFQMLFKGLANDIMVSSLSWIAVLSILNAWHNAPSFTQSQHEFIEKSNILIFLRDNMSPLIRTDFDLVRFYHACHSSLL